MSRFAGMIHDVDEALRKLIRREALNGSDVEVLFDAPTKEWAARRNAPAVDVYLYDVREDLKWRAYGTVDVKGGDGRTTARGAPPRHFKLSYLVTAWTQRPEDEHRLLSALLYCFLKFDALPRDVLGGTLADQSSPVRTTIASPPPEDRALSDTWSALGGELKPSLDLVVTAAVDARGLAKVAPLVMEEPRISVGGSHGADPSEEARRRRRRAAEVGAAGGTGAGAGGTPGESWEEEEAAVPEETVSSGKPGKPGRVIRIRGITEP